MDNRLRTLYDKVKKEHPNKVVSYSHLRIEVALSNSKNTLKFELLKNSGVDAITETKLKKNDKFYMESLGLFLLPQVSTNPGKAVLQTYPNETVFVAAAGFVPGDLEIVYNGKLTFKVGSTEHIQEMDTRQFRFAPQTQQSAAGNKSQADSESGMRPVEPTFGLSGGNDTEVKLEMPLGATTEFAAVAANTTNKVVLFTRGFLAVGAAANNN